MQFIHKFHFDGDSIDIPATPCPVTHTDWTNFILPAGIYPYNESNYALLQEGLYLIFNANVDGGYRCIYNADIPSLMSALSQLTIYGTADESYTDSQLLMLLKTRKVALRCNRTIQLFQYILDSLGIENRMCRVVTAGLPTNFDDGHSPLEVKIHGNWVLYDPSSNCYWTNRKHYQLSLADYFQTEQKFMIQIADNLADNTPWCSYGWASDIFFDCKLRTKNQVQQWINRIYQIPGIVADDTKTYFYLPPGTESREEWLLSLDPNYLVLPSVEWKERFYD